MNDGPPILRISPEFRLREPKVQELLPLPVPEWERLKRLVSRIPEPVRGLEVTGNAAAGVGASALTTLLSLPAVGQKPQWILPLFLPLTVGSLAVAAVALAASRGQARNRRVAVEEAHSEMDEIERRFDHHRRPDSTRT